MDTAGTPLFSAPELLRREQYSEKVDVWSFACVLECMWTHDEPFKGKMDGRPQLADKSNDEVIQMIAREQLRPQARGMIEELVEKCSTLEPESRLSFPEVVKLLETVVTDAMRLPPGPMLLSISATGAVMPAAEPSLPMERSELPRKKTLPKPDGLVNAGGTQGATKERTLRKDRSGAVHV